jgi:hypothetical protein
MRRLKRMFKDKEVTFGNHCVFENPLTFKIYMPGKKENAGTDGEGTVTVPREEDFL